MAEQMLQLVRQLSLQMSQLEKDNQRLQKEMGVLKDQLNRCLLIIDALHKRSPQ
jgi:hypothetical protein